MTVHNLDALFRPASVAVIGASERPGSVGTVVLRNLIDGGFAGPILPVHPRYSSVAGLPAYTSVERLPQAPELAVLCTPPATVPGLVQELGRRGTRAAIVLAAGLAAARDAEGRPLDQQVLALARASGLRLLGPNCVGMLAPHAGLNATFALGLALKGRIAFVSQSGALCTVALDWARAGGIGFSAFVSLGDSLDVDAADAIDWLGSDPHTSAILLYLESLRNARKFLSAARAAARNKPLVAIKAGRGREGERAAASHTGALAGSDEVFDYALRRAGILRVDEIAELFAVAETLARVGTLRGRRLAIVTNGGGPGVMATDTLVAEGGELAQLSASTLAELDRVLPPTWSRGNPVDLIGDADAERYERALRIVAADSAVDALLVMHAPTAVTPGLEVARALLTATRGAKCAILTSWLGREADAAARRLLAAEGLATYDTPSDAVHAFMHLVRHRAGRELLMQTPPRPPAAAAPDVSAVRSIVDGCLLQGGGWLDAAQAMELLARWGFPAVATRRVATEDEAVRAAQELGFPVALKLASPDLLHKSDVGGVTLDLATPEAVREAAAAMRARLLGARPAARLDGWLVQRMARRPSAHELFAGAAVDPIFGPFLVFGRGGTAVEVIRDKALALPPLNLLLAEELVQRTRVSRLLRGYRDRPAADLQQLYALLVRLAELVQEVPEIVELDLNPILCDERGTLVLDARIRLAPATCAGPARLAIRPYPAELEEEVRLAGGRRVLLRPIRPEDEPGHRRLFERLTPQDVRFRFFHAIRELPHSELARQTQIDYDREMAFVAIDLDAPDAQAAEELGVVRGVCDPDNVTAEFAVVVAAPWKGQGLGRLLLQKLCGYLRERGTRTLLGRVLPENAPMLALARELGFEAARREHDDDVEVRLDLQRDEPRAPAGDQRIVKSMSRRTR